VPAGTILLGRETQGIWEVSGSGGTPRPLITLQSQVNESAHTPQRLPGTNAVLFASTKEGGAITEWADSRIVVESLRAGPSA